MLDRINTVEKILNLSIPTIERIIEDSKRPIPGFEGYIDYQGYHRDLQEGLVTLAFQVFAIEQRLNTPYNQVQEPPRPIHVPRTKVICREHRKLRRCLRILLAEIDERQDYLNFYLNLAHNNGWYQGIF